MMDSTALPFASGRGSRRTLESSPMTPTMTSRGRPRRRFRSLAIVIGLLGLGALGWLGYREWDPPALREAASDYRRGNPLSAYHRAIAHLESRPMSRAAALIAAQSLGQLKRSGEAEPYYRRAGPLSLEILHARALALIDARLQDQAVAVYEEILQRTPEDISALRRLAVAQILRSRWNEALAVADRLKRIPRGEVIGTTLAGVVYHDTDRPDAAVEEFHRVLTLDPDLRQMPLQPREQFWVYLIKDMVGLGRGGEARPWLARAISEREDPYYFDLLGESFWQEGQFEEAERSWLKSVELNPRRAQPWSWLGNLDLQGNRLERAVERLERAAALAPSARGPYYSLSQAYGRLGKSDEAARCRSIADRLRRANSTPPRGMSDSRSH